MPRPPGEPDLGFRLTSRLIRSLASEVRASGARFLAVLTENQVGLLDTAAFREEGIRYYVMAPEVKDGFDVRELRWQNDSHYNAEGHRLVAEVLEPIVVEFVTP